MQGLKAALVMARLLRFTMVSPTACCTKAQSPLQVWFSFVNNETCLITRITTSRICPGIAKQDPKSRGSAEMLALNSFPAHVKSTLCGCTVADNGLSARLPFLAASVVASTRALPILP